MVGLGTLINTGAVIGGGLLGLIFKKGMKETTQDSLMKACGISSAFIGISGAVAKALTYENGVFDTQGTMLMIISLIIGTFIGEICHIEDGFERIGERIKKAARQENDNRFVDTFVNVSLIICVGAMAIVGSIQDGISGAWQMLAAKGMLDAIITLVFASTGGIGAAFAAIPVFVLQGGITLIAMFFGSFVSQAIINDIGYVGSVLVLCVGINIIFGKKFRVANMVPAIFVPAVYEVLLSLIQK